MRRGDLVHILLLVPSWSFNLLSITRIMPLGAREDMRFIHLFLIGYFIVIVGIGLALYQTGVLAHVAPIWIGVGALVAIGAGIMLSVSTGKPTVTEELEK